MLKTATVKKLPQRQINQSYYSLVWWKFKKNKLAIFGGLVVFLFYMGMVGFAEFISPYTLDSRTNFTKAPPQAIRFIDSYGQFHIQPFVYGLDKQIDEVLRMRIFVENPTKIIPVGFFVRGETYKLFGLISTNIHLFGVDYLNNPDASVFIMGTDSNGRDYFTRILYGGRLSLMIGLIGQIMTILFGSVLGAISGYYGGATDIVVQRMTEFLAAFPDIPLFMALAAAIPAYWSPILVYFALTLILAFVRWGGLARQVRGLVLSLREREFVLAARASGASASRLMFRHLLPGTISHIIVIATLSIPSMILSETALSWLGLGLRPPLTSWGVLLQEAATIDSIRFSPWMLWTVPFIITTILAFNLLGDGLRDALDPYSSH